MGSYHTGRGTAGSHGAASDDVALHPNPNAPYIVPGATPHLVIRATALDAAHAQPCDPDVLSVEEISGDANGIFRSVKLAFMNRGAVPCRLGGYPAVGLLNSSGEPVGTVTAEKISNAEVIAEMARPHPAAIAEAGPVVTLMPHQAAAFQVLWTTGTDCSRVSQIAVRAPGSERVFTISQPIRICTRRIQITALHLDEGDV
jgi:hypothetical protein